MVGADCARLQRTRVLSEIMPYYGKNGGDSSATHTNGPLNHKAGVSVSNAVLHVHLR
jgi:hypothetical protein